MTKKAMTTKKMMTATRSERALIQRMKDEA
jgi:hypothetical protein